jgi:voltage-gated potassium channel Kch
VGTFGVVWAVGGQHPPVRHGAVATLNLSQMGESALVLIHVGQKLGHIKNDTLTIILWAFFLLAISSTLSFPYNHKIFARLAKMVNKVLGMSATHGDSADAHEDEEGDRLADRNVVLLGFHKVAALMITGFEQHAPHVLDKIHVVDFDEEMAADIHRRGMTYSYGDMSDPEVLQHCHHGNVNLVICSIPDVILHGVNNLQLLKNSKQVWPHADVIVTADNPKATATLYENGADYVLRMSKLGAEKLYEIMVEYSSHASHHHQVHEEMSVKEVFEKHKEMDEATKKKSTQEKA